MRRFFAVFVAFASLAVAGSAAAAAPTKVTQVFDLPSVPFVYTTCGSVEILATRVHIERTFLTFYDQAGNAIRRHRHVFITQTLTSGATGATLTYVLHANAVEDFVENTFKQQGAFRQLHTADGTLVAAGQMVWDDDIDPEVPIVVRGANTIDEFNTAICQFLT